MGQTLAERIQYEAAYDSNLIFRAYAGDLADLMSELTVRAERAEAVLRTMTEQKEYFRVCWEEAEAALDDCRRVVAAIPWRALASIYTHPGVVLDADADAIGEFLDQYADAWAGGFAPSDLGPITQESLLPDVMPPLGRRTIEIMERKIGPSDSESEG